jgi:T5SS/PEP-CTERM-associated repeat protein
MNIKKRYRVTRAASFLLLVFSASTTAVAGWEVIDLHPDGTHSSMAWAVYGARQAGAVAAEGGYHAALWSATAESWIDLHPGEGYYFSVVIDMSDEQQAGFTHAGEGWGWSHAAMWSGTAESWVNLHPAGAGWSRAFGISGDNQVGWAMVAAWVAGELHSFEHASLWTGTAESWVDLNPAGAYESAANAASGGQQVGWANLGDYPRFDGHAGFWTGSAESWVDLHPAGSSWSYAEDVSDGQQVGAAWFGEGFHAGLWSGTAESWVDLNPPGSTESIAYGIAGARQAGVADGHAAIWSGTAESFFDLHDLLGPEYSASEARSIDVSGDDIWVAGTAYQGDIRHAVLWHYTIPEPASIVLLVSAAAGMCLRINFRNRQKLPRTSRISLTSTLAIALSATITEVLPAATVVTGDVRPSLPWDSSTTANIGNNSSGALAVDAGSQLVSGSAHLGYDYPGEATITGAGSRWTNSEALYVGRPGGWFGLLWVSGTLTVEDGGEVTTGTLWASLEDLHGDGTITATKGAVIDADLTFDDSHGTHQTFPFGSGGTLAVDFTDEGALGVGYKGLGSLTVTDGIAISSSSGHLGGLGVWSTGRATITGPGSTWTTDEYLSIGNVGSGALEITGGGTVRSANANIGSSNIPGNGSAQVTVDGPGSTWTNSGGLGIGWYVGDIPWYGVGTLTITGGGLVSVGGGLGISSGSLNMSRGGMLALEGDADDSLTQFLGLVGTGGYVSTDWIRYWKADVADWAPLTEATYGDDYTLEYLTSGDLAGYTLLTVGVVVPEPATFVLLILGVVSCCARRRRTANE